VDLGAIGAAREADAALPRLKLRGLMAVPSPRPMRPCSALALRNCASCVDRLSRDGLRHDTLSMGNVADLEAAIAEGAALVRVGTGDFWRKAETSLS